MNGDFEFYRGPKRRQGIALLVVVYAPSLEPGAEFISAASIASRTEMRPMTREEERRAVGA